MCKESTTIKDKFDENISDLEICSCKTETVLPHDYSSQCDKFDKIHFEFDAIKAMLNISIDTLAVGTLNTKGTVNHSALKMLAIELPKFNGDITQWQAFHDLFLMLVRSNRSLHKSSLQGEASPLVSMLPVTDANYEVARYLIVQINFQHSLDSSDCIQSIKGLLNLVTENIGALKVISLPTSVRCNIVGFVGT
ncbi:hypothetical protein PR048_018780 [Dryococelus australis]|uniref:Uncharacterized protein n=1 Tax=Dryococelus australis TaxID=614101 RepID=A0ABQ9H1M2_9NEOP|nr:hypothetical protein PR048_018780 [Dryococelus australis]